MYILILDVICLCSDSNERGKVGGQEENVMHYHLDSDYYSVYDRYKNMATLTTFPQHETRQKV